MLYRLLKEQFKANYINTVTSKGGGGSGQLVTGYSGLIQCVCVLCVYI